MAAVELILDRHRRLQVADVAGDVRAGGLTQPWQGVAKHLARLVGADLLRVGHLFPAAPAARNGEMEPGGTAAGSLAHGLNQSGRRGGLMRDDENGCRLLIHELTSK